MVTVRQFSRGVGRTMRAIDRDAKRAQRNRAAAQREALKVDMLESAADAASQYAELISALTGSHGVVFTRRDWSTTAKTPVLQVPERLSANEDRARVAAADYEPGWLARTFGREARARAALEQAIIDARLGDDEAYQGARALMEQRNNEIEHAKRVMNHNPDALVAALDAHSELGDLPFAVEAIDIVFAEDRVIAMVDGLDLEDMPTQSVTLLQSGKASIKALPKTKVLELHRENICSSALRVAVEILKTLPIEAVEVVMHSDLLDRSSGHVDADPVLYVRVTAPAVTPLNLSRTDAVALVERLGGRFDWNQREGFTRLSKDGLDIPAESSRN